MSPIHVEFSLTGQDYERYLRYFYAHTKVGRRHMRRLYLIGVALFLLFVWKEYDHPKFGIANPGYFASYLAISGVLLGGGYWYAITRLWPAIAQFAVQLSPQKGMFTETKLTLDDTGMQVETQQGIGRLDWRSLRDTAETDDALYLFMGGINAFIIPKRGFENGDDSDAALACIARALE